MDSPASSVCRHRLAETTKAHNHVSVSVGILYGIENGIFHCREFLEPYEFAIEFPAHFDIGNNKADFNLGIECARFIRSDD